MKYLVKFVWKQIAVLQLICLCGCVSSVALRNDYDNYSDVYGDAINKQLLLNIARESQQDPVYFLQLASISSQYQFSTSAGFTPSATRTAPPSGAMAGIVQHALTLGGSASAGVTQTPQFQFLPLNGSNYVQAVLTPIPDRVFWTFYDQAWPANWVVRTMVDSIQKITTTNCFQTNIVGSVTNITTNSVTSKIENYVNDPSDPTYPKFLECCDALRYGQLFQTLSVEKVRGDKTLVFASTNSKTKLADVAGAISSGLSVVYTNNSIRVETKPEDIFRLATNKYSNVDEYTHYISNRLSYIDAGLALSNAISFTTNFANGSFKFKPRTFEGIMNSVATEEAAYKLFTHSTNLFYSNNITFTNDAYGPIAIVTRTFGTGTFTNRPILRITDTNWPGYSKLIGLDYKGVNYSIGDFTDGREDVFPADTAQNRAVFTMISYLFSQVAIDTSKLPVQQLIQVQ
jgi:hypothetical protein